MRFKFDRDASSYSKVHDHIDIDIELDMSEFSIQVKYIYHTLEVYEFANYIVSDHFSHSTSKP